MSKKIIYLLSLLMALSLVFASCKKNSVTDSLNGGPVDVPDPITPPSDLGNGGLYDSWDKLALKANEPVQRTGVWKYDGNYSRNPVIVVLGEQSNAVLMVSELRYEKPGAANDIGVDGSTAVDIQWALSTDAGVSFDTGSYSSGVIHSGGSDYSKAHGAPVVFKVDKDTVVVVASSGAAISRTAESYATRQAAGKGSRIEYTVGTMSGNNMDWTPWKEIEKIQEVVSQISSTLSDGTKFQQFGTHSARGFTTTDGKSTMLLSVVMAVQGTTGDYRESMGYLLVKGNMNGDTDVTWNVGTTGEAKAFQSGGDRFSKHKEARIIGGTESAPQYIVVPNGSSTLQLAVGTGFTDPSYTISGGDGSLGSVTVAKWFGDQEYNPSDLTSTVVTAPKPQAILSHVANIEANLKLYLMDDAFKTIKGKAYDINKTAKSSSIDVLGDGTIVTAAEEGWVNSQVSRSFVINFTRYTQQFLANQTGNVTTTK